MFTNTGKLKVHFVGNFAFHKCELGEFPQSNGTVIKKFLLPCGKCIGCKLDKAKTWALRCMHEAKFHSDSCWLTLTYDDVHLPRENGYSKLVKSDLQKFIKRLRKDGCKFKYFGCGEYGDKTGRCHFHIILFGYRPTDLEVYKRSKEGFVMYNSAYLQKKWKNGFVVVADVSFDTAGYTARYSMKKQFKTEIINPNEEIYEPFLCMSTKPAIGKEWYNTFKDDVFPNDKVVFYRNGEPVITRPPRYYEKLFELENPALFEAIKQKRLENINQKSISNYVASEYIKEQKMSRFHTRDVEI